MSAIMLPSLTVGGKLTKQVLHQISENSPKGTFTSHKYKNGTGKRSAVTKNGRNNGNSKSTNRDFIDTARFRYSAKHNICLEMLQEGYHWAFEQLFNLLQQNRQMTATVGDNPDEVPNLIEEDTSKLEALRHHLSAAETSRRRGRMDVVYDSQLALAHYFNGTGDNWLADHFYMCCLETSSQLHGDNSKKEAEAHYNLGLAAEKRDNYAKAIELQEKFYELTSEKPWESEDGQPLNQVACDSLRRLYTQVADELENENPDEALQYLIKAYEMAKESEQETKIAYSGFLLGNAYERQGDPQTSILYHKNYLDVSQKNEDRQGIGNACHSLSRSYQRLNDVDHAVEYLETYLRVAEELGDTQAQEAACSEMGQMYGYLGNYQQASYYLSKAYDKAKGQSDGKSIDLTRVKFGMAVGHCVFFEMANKIVINDRRARDYLIDWKSMRLRDELSAEDSTTRLHQDQIDTESTNTMIDTDADVGSSSSNIMEEMDKT